MKKSIFLKIFGGYFFTICLLAGCIFFFSFKVVKDYHIQTLTGQLQKFADTVLLQIDPLLQQHNFGELDRFVKGLGRHIDTRVTVIDIEGTVLADSEKDPRTMENHKTRPEVIQAVYGSPGSSLRYSTTVEEPMLYVAVPVWREGAVGAVLRMSLFVRDINVILTDLRNSILSIALVIMGIALAGSYIIARRLTGPIRKLSDASGALPPGISTSGFF